MDIAELGALKRLGTVRDIARMTAFEQKEEEEYPILKTHYPTPEELQKSVSFQNSADNYALILAISDYEGVSDPQFGEEFKSLPQAINDACAIKRFLL